MTARTSVAPLAQLLACSWVVLLLLQQPSPAQAGGGPVGAFKSDFDWAWKEGRATWFGDGDWPIHIGGCNYDYLFKDEGWTASGWDVVALADVHPEYVGSCGGCWEVQCKNGWTKDYYGEQFDRNVCRDESASVIVRSVDTCQCTYPPNAFSNKRWCCGDIDHMDISKWAFEKLAELRWGVLKLQYRPVPCDYKPQKLASISNPSPGIPQSPPWDAKRQTRDWPDLRSDSIVPHIMFNDGWLQNDFKDVSWNAWLQPLEDSKSSGMLGGPGLCGSINNEGALAFKAWNGIFQNKVAIEFWTYVGYAGSGGYNADIPDISIGISGKNGGCDAVRFQNAKPIMFQPNCKPFCTDYWWGYRVYLPAFTGASPTGVINDPNQFSGCGGNSVWDLDTIEFRHDNHWQRGSKWVCLDRVHMV